MGVNHPGSQEDLVSNWEPAGSLVKGAISETKIGPRLPTLAATCLPLCLQRGQGPVRSQLALLWYLLSPLFCEQAWQCFSLELFAGKFFLSLFFFFSLSLDISQFRLLSHISSLRLSSGHSGSVLTLSMLPAPPSSAPAHCWQAGVSGLLFCWELWLGTYSVGVFLFVCFKSSWLCCPLRFQNSAQTHR